jgi:hypothetical protein
MIAPEVIPIGTRAGTRWLVVMGESADMFETEDQARDYAQVLIVRAEHDEAIYSSRCRACGGLGWLAGDPS